MEISLSFQNAFFMKKNCMIILLLLVTFSAFAQKPDSIGLSRFVPVDLLRESIEYKGFMITLRTEAGRDYRFDILMDNKPIEYGFPNPLPFSRGIRRKDDAYKIAEWIINEYQKTGHWKHTMPPHIARELKIESN
jgi:hypothetical protein